MRVYLVIVDESDEARLALRYASRRAASTGGVVHLLTPVAPEPFNAFAGVQATIEEEARARAETLATTAAGSVAGQSGAAPVIAVRMGEAVKVVRQYLAEQADVSALVLGAAAQGEPGPLVTHFAAMAAGTLPCPVIVIPGSLDAETLDRLS